MRAKVGAFVVLALAAGSVTVPQTASATQTWSLLALSRNGHHWSTDLRRPLFDEDTVLIPGSELTSTFYVRNQSGEPADLAVTVRGGRHLGLLDLPGFRLALRGAHGWQQVVQADGAPTLQLRLPKGAVRAISARVRLIPGALNRAQQRRLDLSLEVRLSQRTEQTHRTGARP